MRSPFHVPPFQFKQRIPCPGVRALTSSSQSPTLLHQSAHLGPVVRVSPDFSAVGQSISVRQQTTGALRVRHVSWGDVQRERKPLYPPKDGACAL